MRKIIKFSIVVALCVFPMFHSISALAQTSAEIEEIELTQEVKPNSQSEGRNIVFISAYFNHQTSEIEIFAVGVGTSIITLKNPSGQIVAQTITNPTDGIGSLYVPEISGVYQIIIDSKGYYLYGFFTKM